MNPICFACGVIATHQADYEHFTAYFCDDVDHQLLFHYNMSEQLGIKISPRIQTLLSSSSGHTYIRQLVMVHGIIDNIDKIGEEWLGNVTTTSTTPIIIQPFVSSKTKKLSFTDKIEIPDPSISTGKTQNYRRIDIEFPKLPQLPLVKLLEPPLKGFQLRLDEKDKSKIFNIGNTDDLWNSLLLNIEDPSQGKNIIMRTYADKSRKDDSHLFIIFKKNQCVKTKGGIFYCDFFLSNIQIYMPL